MAALSSRAQELSSQPPEAYFVWHVLKDQWHPTENPTGYVSLGLAENTMSHQTLSKHVHERLALDTKSFTYGTGTNGSTRLRTSMGAFLTKRLPAYQPIRSCDITITNGCSGALEQLSWCLANPGDAFLLGRPYYNTFVPDMTLRAGAKIVPVAFGDVDPFALGAIKSYEDEILHAHASGQKIAGIILCNPHNPLGRCYSTDFMIQIMALCEKHQVHLISDEIYALSIWPNTIDEDPPATAFTSALSINPANVIDPGRVHVVWGMSKDFGANGFRLGAIISQHPTLHTALIPLSLYSSPSSISDHLAANILEDETWTDAYLLENRRKLAAHHGIAVAWAKKHQIPYVPGVNAAFFLWVNLGLKYRQSHPTVGDEELEETVAQALKKNKVYLGAGKAFGAEQIGWFRIVFSVDRLYLEEGLERIAKSLEN